VRNADAIDPNSRTLLIEVDVKNPTGELLPGSYASVHLKLTSRVRSVTVPANALLFRSEGLRVAVVRNGRTDLVPVVLGHDYGDKVEIVSGITSRSGHREPKRFNRLRRTGANRRRKHGTLGLV